jgi:release factor glutamine methyltransferase
VNALQKPSLPGLAPDVTIAQARRAMAQAFEAAGIDSPDVDARILAGFALSLGHAGLSAEAGRRISASETEKLLKLALRRLGREPVARIVGVKEFWSLPLALSAETLVPRPETEIVVEAALAVLRDRGSALIADFGTGSGAILLALLHEMADARGVGTDISVNALTTARGNTLHLGLGARAHFVCCNFGAALRGPFDCIVSNPPYISSDDIADLAREVRDFDPRLALDGGADGLEAYRHVAAHAQRLLRPGGHLIVELGAGQEADVTAIMSAAELASQGPARRDLNGIPRALTMQFQP